MLCYNYMLCYAALCYAMLRYAMLCYVMVRYAMLCYAIIICSAMLHYAMLCCATLCYAMLCCVMLCYAVILCYAALCDAILCCITLCYAALYSMLRYATLRCAILTRPFYKRAYAHNRMRKRKRAKRLSTGQGWNLRKGVRMQLPATTYVATSSFTLHSFVSSAAGCYQSARLMLFIYTYR